VNVARFEYQKSTEFYIDAIGEAYGRTAFDIQKGVGRGFSISGLSEKRVSEILRHNWSGAHYSSRIWNNTSQIAARVKQDLLAGFLSGKSGAKMARELQDDFGVGAMEARRLVRTETNYMANQAELESYADCGIDQYEYLATLDGRTSTICQGLDGKRYPIEQAVPGQNYPPMHPFCRSTTVAVIGDEEAEGMMRRARDPVTGKTYLVPADMTYGEWEKQYLQSGKAGINSLKNGAQNGIINIEIDEFVPCLKDAETGKILDTEVAKFVDRSALKPYTKKAGWNVDWAKMPPDVDVYGLYLKGDSVVQGLVGIKDSPKQQAVYLHWASTAPHNNKLLNDGQQKYTGVGGHLFAIGAEESIKRGYDGYMYGYGANEKVTKHYRTAFFFICENLHK
jgi:SPP1 gp7 family putative phage head morphogenesis protein